MAEFIKFAQGALDATFPDGTTCTLESGATLTVASGAELVVAGTLTLTGTAAHTGTQTFDDIIGNDAILEITGTAGSAGAGGAIAGAGGAGDGAFNGGATSWTGGNSGSGATGNGGASSIAGGAALSTNGNGGAASVTGGVATGTGTGGALTFTSGASAGASGTAGDISIDTGAAAGGTGGGINIGTTNATDITCGAPLYMGGNGIGNTAAVLTFATGATGLATFAGDIATTNLDAGASGVAGSVDIFPASVTSGKFIIACDDQTGDTAVTLKPNAMGQATTVNIPDPGAADAYMALSTAALTMAELDVLDAVSPGTVTASLACVVDADKDLAAFRNVGVVNLDAGSSGVAGTVDIFPSTVTSGKLTLACTDQTGDTAVEINANAMGQATTVNIADPGIAASYLLQSTAAITVAEANVLDGATEGTIVASKAVVVDANDDVTGFRQITCSEDGTVGIALTGTYTTTAVQLGTTGTPLILTAHDDHIIDLYSTSGSTDAANSVRPIYAKSTMTGAGGVGGRAEFHMYTNVGLGGWSNALKGFAEYGATGSTTGLGSAFCAELSLSAGTTIGTYAAIEAEINAGAACSTGTGTSFLYVNGTDDSGLLNDNAYLFEIGGVFTSEATHMWYDHQGGAPANVEEWIKIRTPGGVRWLAAYDAVV